MESTYSNKLLDIYSSQGNQSISNRSTKEEILLRLYLFYEYYNADETAIDDLEESITDFTYFGSIQESKTDIDEFDLIHVFNQYSYVFSKSFDVFLTEIDTYFIKLFNGYREQDMARVRTHFGQLSISSKTKLTFTILFERELDYDTKKTIRETISKYEFETKNLDIAAIFEDEIEEIIKNINSPVNYVKFGTLNLFSNEIMTYGEEKSVVTSISAKSLKDIYIRFATKGLFESNLRYYIKSAKIDAKIKNSIIREPDKFWYFNNGIIITCDDYRINENVIELTNFSIVNGGQTTNLIGNTDFDNDFSLICKIIKKKYDDPILNKEFLGKIAEATNTQKPIKPRDLISNRIEQKLLKEQFAQMDIFLNIKRGEKINKEIYKYKWQNASNEEVGQMLFSYIYQHPGIARNGKSKMLENEEYYQTIFADKYQSLLFKNFQLLKVNHHSWKQYMKQYGTSEIFGLVKNGFFFFMATLGFIAKYNYNQYLRDYIEEIDLKNDIADDVRLKSLLSYNDIGDLSCFVESSITTTDLRVRNKLFDIIYMIFIQEGYSKYKERYPGSAYSNFTKNDTNYYRYVLPEVIRKLKNEWTHDTFNQYFGDYFMKYNGFIAPIPPLDPTDSNGLDLLSDLKAFRSKVYRKLGGSVQQYQILTNKQMNKIAVQRPRNKEDLMEVAKLSTSIYESYADEIVEIVARYRTL